MILVERYETNKVLGKEIEVYTATVSAPLTGYLTPLALIMIVCLGVVFDARSFSQNVLWFVARESTIQPFYMLSYEVRKAQLLLPSFCVFADSMSCSTC